jgi:hypothetical protein
MKHKYYFEIDTGGVEASGYEDRLPWVSYGTIVAEGNTLEECLENASVDLVDQDGGNPRCSPVEADEQWMQDLIIEKFYGEHGLTRNDKETIGDFQARVNCLHPDSEDYDPSPWCSDCGAMKRTQCDCGPRAAND